MTVDFKLPGSSYDELVKMIKAYANAKKTTLEELSKLSGVPESNISRNSVFLISTGIIDEKDRTATENGASLAKALEFDIAKEISDCWRTIAVQTEFIKKMLTALKIRNGMDEESFKTHIAYSSGQKSSNYVKIGALTLINILKIAGLISEQDGKLQYERGDRDSDDGVSSNKERLANDAVSGDTLKAYTNELKNKNVVVNINIEVKKADFPDIIDYIKKLIDSIG